VAVFPQNNFFSKNIYMYRLEWPETTGKDGSVVLLGGKICCRDGQLLHIEFFDEAAEWKFLFIRYPHADSNVPDLQPVGVFQGQLVRFPTIRNSTHGGGVDTSPLGSPRGLIGLPNTKYFC
jgi:hypothetical protein